MKQVYIFREEAFNLNEIINKHIKVLVKSQCKILDIKISASRFSETVMIIYEKKIK